MLVIMCVIKHACVQMNGQLNLSATVKYKAIKTIKVISLLYLSVWKCLFYDSKEYCVCLVYELSK